MTRLLLLICLVISFNPDVKATAQLPELLVISNDTFAMTSTPLQNHPRYRQIHNKMRWKTHKEPFYCTRQYVGIWILEEGQLYLKKICSPENQNDTLDLKKVFGIDYVNGKIRAVWVTNEIWHWQGRRLKYIHMGFESVYEYDVRYVLENGFAVTRTEFSNQKTRLVPMAQSDSLFWNYVSSQVNWKKIKNSGLISEVRINFKNDINGRLLKINVQTGSKELKAEIKRIIARIPEWDLYYKRGKPFTFSWIFYIELKPEHIQKYISGKR